jgi:hypothetical protein
MHGVMVCGEFPDIRCGRITSALRDNGIHHGVSTLKYPPQLDDVYDFVDWRNTDGARGVIERTLSHDCDIFHVHGEIQQFWPVVFLKEKTNKPVILNIHDLPCSRVRSILDRYEAEAIEKADALVWVTETQRQFGESMGLNVDKPYCIVPNYPSRRFFINETPLPHIGGIVIEGGMDKRGNTANDIDYSKIADTVEVHLYSGSNRPDYGIVHRTETDYHLLIQRLAQHDWGFCGSAYENYTWTVALPTKMGEYFAAGIPVIGLNCPAVKPFCDMGMGVYLESVEELKDLPDPAPYKEKVFEHRDKFTTENAIGPLVELYNWIGA